VDFRGLACPQAPGLVTLDFDVTVSRAVPSSLAYLEIEITSEGSAGKLLCAKIHTSPGASFNADPEGNAPIDFGVVSSGKLAQHDSLTVVPPANLPEYYLIRDNRTLQTLRNERLEIGSEEFLRDVHLCPVAPRKEAIDEKCGVCQFPYVTFCSVDGTKIWRQVYKQNHLGDCQHPWRVPKILGEVNVARREPTCEEPDPFRKDLGRKLGYAWAKEVDSGIYYSLPAAPVPPPPRPAPGPAPPPPPPAPAPASWAQRALVADEGNNLKSLNLVTSDDCKAECEADTACHSFSFSHSKRRCHLKDKCVTAGDATDHNPSHVGYVTHYKPCKQDEMLV